MPYVPKADGRGYGLFPATTDPVPLALNGKLYSKKTGGEVQLFFQSDLGVIYQITPGGAAVYPFQLPETATPAPLANTGKLYAKDVAGVSQLFFLADDGTESQLTPAAGGSGQIADFVYDVSGVEAGNVYTTFGGVVAACNALGCTCRVRIVNYADPDIDTTLTDGSRYDIGNIQFWSTESGAGTSGFLWLKGAGASNFFRSANMMFHNIVIQYEGTFEPLLTVQGGAARCMVKFTGKAGIQIVGAGPQPFFYNNGGELEIEFQDAAVMPLNIGGPIQKVFDSNGGAIITVRATSDLNKGFTPSLNPWTIAAFCTVTARVVFHDLRNNPIPYTIAAFMGAQNGSPQLGRRSNAGLGQTDLELNGSGQLGFDHNFSTDVLRITPLANITLSGLESSQYNPVFANQGLCREMRFLNVAPVFTVTLNHEDAGATAQNRFITSTGAPLVMLANQMVWMFFDVTSQRWRVWLMP